MSRKVQIVILDSGVDVTHPLFQDTQVFCYDCCFDELSIEDRDGHGTAVYHIIRRLNKEAEIINIKLFTTDWSVGEDTLIAALEFVAKHFQPDIVNMSLGCRICDDSNALYNACKKLTDTGAILISAFDNAGCLSYPAAYENVIGVATGKFCHKNSDFEYCDDVVVNIAGYGGLQRVAWTNPRYVMLYGSSFACAHVAAQAARFISEGARTKDELLRRFKEISIRKYERKNKKERCELFKIERAALFPFNKEMHALVRFAEMLPFKIVGVYDRKFSASIGASTSVLLKDEDVTDIRVQNIDHIDWNSFDTLILGCVSELISLTGQKVIKNIIKDALERSKKIYSFGNISNLLSHPVSDRVFFPKIDDEDLPPDRFGMLYAISKPVLGIFGTSSRQGKFTLQLMLRKLFLEHGLRVGQIGTEPSALLFGMDFVYPMGHESTVYIKEYDTVRWLNEAMHSLCKQDNDIIMVGSQSGTLQYFPWNLEQCNIAQYNFLIGTMPDAIILCLNPYDELNFVIRTISFLESTVGCKVIALAVFPMEYRDDWSIAYGEKKALTNERFQKLKEELYEKCHVDIYNIGSQSDIIMLFEKIIRYFRA